MERDGRMLCVSGRYDCGDSRNVKEAWVSPVHKIQTNGVKSNEAALSEEKVQSDDGSQDSLSLERHPVCQEQLFQAKSTKVLPSRIL